jgi:hypothetical protein
MSLFVNYVAHPARSTPLNLAVARILVCLYAAWKVGTYPFGGLADFPAFLFLDNPLAQQNNFFAMPHAWLRFIPLEQALIVVCLLLVALGWRVGVTAFLGAFLLAHLSGLNFLIINEKTFLLTIYFLIFCGLFRKYDGLTPGDLKRLLAGTTAPPRSTGTDFPMPALRAFLVTFSLIYFFTGVAKWQGGGLSLAWANAENIRIIVQSNALYHIHETPLVASWIMPHDAIFAGAGLLTLLLELGFVAAVLARWSITPFILGLACMHAGILATMHLNYLSDMAVFYAVFIPWDSLVARLARRRVTASTLRAFPESPR